MLGVGIWHDWLTVPLQDLNRSNSLREMFGFWLPHDGVKSGSRVLLDARICREMFRRSWP